MKKKKKRKKERNTNQVETFLYQNPSITINYYLKNLEHKDSIIKDLRQISFIAINQNIPK